MQSKNQHLMLKAAFHIQAGQYFIAMGNYPRFNGDPNPKPLPAARFSVTEVPGV
ncbi:hypothetical protein [Serratia plymuthica]|uniref:Uncharacterized protein n=1 Tax=Serratia plymuthica S13 TaxID=1348660 RepID=S4YVL8_SERPL|nr:hypothetical protein [Serratia plymuthica]AGP46938.1 hypothetical protein M621_08875 [Serratia plymuthica S13]KYG15363.1 hypothetical protein SOD10_35090 [Serratia plymuthica]QQT82152.1 hypothetical protein I6I95_24675 [Serratia plymuthica]